MSQDYLADKVAAALGRAQALTFTVFSAALLIGFVALSNLADRQSEIVQLQAELSNLTNIANHGDNVLRELRRYILLRLPPGESDENAVRWITFSATDALQYADEASKRLLNESFETINDINHLLVPLRDTMGKNVSNSIDLAPQSINVFNRLETFRLQDLAVLARLIAVDPVRLAGTLKTFVDSTGQDVGVTANRLKADLQRIGSEAKERQFALMTFVGENLREAVEKRSYDKSSNLVVGGLASSFEETLQRVRELEGRKQELVSSLRGEFKIDVTVVGRAIPVRLVVGLFPIGLIVGFGMVAASLMYASRQLANCDSADSRSAAADCGLMFDQLLNKPILARGLAWASLIVLLALPLITASAVIFQYASTLSTLVTSCIWILLAIAAVMALNILRVAWLISGHVAG